MRAAAVTGRPNSGTLGRMSRRWIAWLAVGVLAGSSCGDDGGTADAGSRDAAGEPDTGPAPTDSGPPSDDAGSAEDAGGTGDTWATFSMGFFATYCVECHQDPTTPGRRDYRTIDHVRRDSVRTRCGVAPSTAPGCDALEPRAPAARMFPVGDGPFPMDDERQRIVDWIDSGLPE